MWSKDEVTADGFKVGSLKLTDIHFRQVRSPSKNQSPRYLSICIANSSGTLEEIPRPVKSRGSNPVYAVETQFIHFLLPHILHSWCASILHVCSTVTSWGHTDLKKKKKSIQAHIHTCRQLQVANQPIVLVFGLGEESGSMWREPRQTEKDSRPTNQTRNPPLVRNCPNHWTTKSLDRRSTCT